MEARRAARPLRLSRPVAAVRRTAVRPVCQGRGGRGHPVGADAGRAGRDGGDSLEGIVADLGLTLRGWFVTLLLRTHDQLRAHLPDFGRRLQISADASQGSWFEI